MTTVQGQAEAQGPATRSTASGKRLEVQGMRALAVILVVAFHAELPVRGGFIGVDAFFVISGYFMTSMLYSELAARGRIQFGSFYSRRVRRLVPALSVVVVATTIGSALIQSPFGDQQQTGASGVATMLFLGNFAAAKFTAAGYFSTSSAIDPLLHMWSLGVEEQFYLFFPVFLLLLLRASGRHGVSLWHALFSGILVTMTVSYVLAYAVSEQVSFGRRFNPSLAFYMFPTRIWEFGAGALVALLAARPAGSRAPARLAATGGATVGVILLLGGAFTIDGATAFPGLAAVIPTFGTALLLHYARVDKGPVSWALRSRPMVFVGNLSYSWYLWHWPAAVFARYLTASNIWIAVAAIGSLLPAYLTYRYVENPFRYRRIRISRSSAPRLFNVATISTSTLCVTLAVGAYLGWGSAALHHMRQTARPGIGQSRGCTVQGWARESDFSKCTWPSAQSRGRILLVGDSHAGALIDGVRQATAEMNYSLTALDGSSCSFTPASTHENTEVANCHQLYLWNLHRAANASLVVISHDSSARSAEPGGLAGWIAALSVTLRALRAAHVPVLLIEDVPQVQKIPSACRFGLIIPLNCSTSRAYNERLKAGVRRAEVQLARRIGPDIRIWDPTDTFCTSSVCSARRKDILRYSDNQHLSGAGSSGLSSVLRKQIHLALGRHL